jgi:hypothetical protein
MSFLMNLHILPQFFLLLLEVSHVLKLLLVLLSVSHPIADVFNLMTLQLKLLKIFKRGVISHAELDVNNV